MAGKILFTSILTTKYVPQQLDVMDRAIAEIATDVHRRAVILAPKDTRALVSSGRVDRDKPATYKVSFGGGRVPYAKRRHYENRRNPQTLRYLERAGMAINRSGINKYFKGMA